MRARDLPPLTDPEESLCSACGASGRDVIAMYYCSQQCCTNRDSIQPANWDFVQGAHMHRTCTRCGFKWFERTLMDEPDRLADALANRENDKWG